MNEKISLTDIVDIDRWQKIQNHFADVLGVSIRSVDNEGNLITRTSNPARFCEEILSSSPQVIAKCKRCLPSSLANVTVDNKWKDGYQCHLGLYNFSIPVVAFENHVVARILVGPVFLGKRRETGGYTQKARELGIDLDKLIDSLIEIKVFTFTGIQSAVELINEITGYVAQLGYDRFRLEKIVPLPKIGKMVHKFYIERILGALLDVSFNTTKAEFGSIMLLDEDSGELYIKVAKGIDNDIIKNTRIKIGEGLAGLAVEEKRFILLDDNLADKRIKARLKRPEIKSALVAPLKIKNRPLGVMNIGTSHPSNRITPEKVETLHRLIELTEATLTDLFKI